MRKVLVPLVLLSCGCALTSKATPVELRFFTPEQVDAVGAPRPEGRELGAVRLGRVTSAANLRSRIVHRDSDVELGEYETLRWTENPEAYVRRAVGRALFQDRPVQQVVGGPAPTLDVDVVAFEEIRRGTRRAGRVQLYYRLEDERRVLASGLVSVERDAAGPDIVPCVEAIEHAMRDASAEVAQAVVAQLGR